MARSTALENAIKAVLAREFDSGNAFGVEVTVVKKKQD
jgi:hypothetical protein